MNNEHRHLIVELFKNKMLKFGDFTLKSGINTPIYVDIRTSISYPQCFQMICDFFYELMAPLQYDFICGVPYSALTFASAICYNKKIPMLLKRKEAKQYGTKKIIEGDFVAGEKCLLIEDIITTGASLIETIDALESSGLIVTDICALVERNQGGAEFLQSRGYKVHNVFNLISIINELYLCNLIPLKEKQKAIEALTLS